jgi:hypothetical protein
MNNIIFQVGIILIFVLLSSCSIKDIIEIANDPSPVKVQPWEYDVNVPVFNKTYYMTSFYSNLPAFSGNYSQETAAIPAWPSNTSVNIAGTSTISTGSITIDFNNDSVADATVKIFRSTDASITLKFTLYNNAKTIQHPIDITNIANPDLTVDNVKYDFTEPQSSGNSVIFRSGFLTSSTDWCIDPGSFTAGPISFDIKSQPASFQANDILVIDATFNFGNTAEVIVDIPSKIQLISTAMPINNIPFIDNFKLDIQFDNSLANEFEIDVDSNVFPVSAGNIGYSLGGSHYYALTQTVTDEIINLKKNGTDPVIKLIIDKSKDFLVKGNSYVRLSRNGKISAKITVSGKTNN